METIAVFSGNRAEFGIMFPIVVELSKHFELSIVLSGAHVLPPWETYKDVQKQLDDAGLKYNLSKIELVHDDTYQMSLAEIYEQMISYYKKNTVDYALVLGDRIESFGFSLASFYSRIPLIHLCGGDVTEVANYDSNVRHSISKLANYHMVTSDLSKTVLLQLGEEEKRIVNIGNPSFDYERMGLLPNKEMLNKAFGVGDNDFVGILTYHPAADKSGDKNFADFQIVYNAAVKSRLDRLFITYPNNDPGYDEIVAFLEKKIDDEKVRIIKSFGTFNYLGMMKNYKTIIIGNSSSGLLETAFYQVPVIDIGERQNGRIHGTNVTHTDISWDEINDNINKTINHYNELKQSYEKDRYLFGDGCAAVKALQFLESISKTAREEQMFKKFVVRKYQ